MDLCLLSELSCFCVITGLSAPWKPSRVSVKMLHVGRGANHPHQSSDWIYITHAERLLIKIHIISPFGKTHMHAVGNFLGIKAALFVDPHRYIFLWLKINRFISQFFITVEDQKQTSLFMSVNYKFYLEGFQFEIARTI